MGKLTDQQKIDIVKEYLELKTSGLQLSKKYNVSTHSIFSILKKRGIKTRGNNEVSRKYTLDTNYFEKINTEHKAYFLGLMYADGYNHQSRNTVIITLQEQDKHILESFNEQIKHNKPLYFIERNKKNSNWKNVYKLEINNKKISLNLAQLGCIQKKALVLTFPTFEQVPKDLVRHFIRGYLDGDGNIGDRQVSIVSSKFFVSVLANYLDSIGIESKIYKAKKENEITRRLCLRTQKDCIKFLDFIYNDSKIFLKRKYKKYVLFKKKHG